MKISAELQLRIEQEIDKQVDLLEDVITDTDEDYLIGVREGLLRAKSIINKLKYQLRREERDTIWE